MAKDKINIVVDAGNTLIKSGLFANGKLQEQKSWQSPSELTSYISKMQPDQVGYISVKDFPEDLQKVLTTFNPRTFTTSSPLPVSIDYETLDTLGIDRLIGAIGAYYEYPGHSALVIDMGSCITYDLITADGTYMGGIISPGYKMRQKAMAHFTSRLPDISSEQTQIPADNIGKTTRQCMTIGTERAIIHEIEGFIHDYHQYFPDLQVVIAGGDARYFESKLKQPIFADANLILKGLNQLLELE